MKSLQDTLRLWASVVTIINYRASSIVPEPNRWHVWKCVVQVGKAEAGFSSLKVAMIAMPQDLVQETEVSFFERKLHLNSYS